MISRPVYPIPGMREQETRPRTEAEEGTVAKRGLWSDFSFVASSRYREEIVLSLAAGPKLPRQLAEDTHIRIAHVSRALGELKERGLVECLTPETKTRGRVYGVTGAGTALVATFRTSRHRYLPVSKRVGAAGFVPKIRGSFPARCISYLKAAKEEAQVRKALSSWSVNPDELTDETWLSVDAFDEFLELLEAAFGDGSYGFIRSLAVQTAPRMSSIKEQVLKAIPIEALAEAAPIVYNKEWNYGRLEVKSGRRWASFQHFDAAMTPGMCAMFQGVYEGILRARGMPGEVRKTRCIRTGDDHCEYLARW